MAVFDSLKRLVAGRLRKAPVRDTQIYARLMSLGGYSYMKDRPLPKPTPTNLRRFAKTPYARRAMNRIKNPIAMLEWEVAPKHGIDLNPELERQIAVVTACLNSPNLDDSFRSFTEQIIEDLLTGGGGTYEHELGGDPARPLWMWPVDVLSIEVFAGWNNEPDKPRYMQVLGYGNVGGVQGKPLLDKELVYIRKDPSTDSPFSWGPLEVAFNAINRLLGVSSYAGDMASNAQPENMLLFRGMTQEQIQAVRNFWRNEVEGQGQMPIFSTPADKEGAGQVQVEKLRGANDEALYLKYQEMLIREIAVSFEISPMTLALQQDVNRNTAETLEDMDWDNTIIPMARNFQSYVNRQSIHGLLGFSQIEFRFIGLDREDEDATSKILERYYKMNALTPNEIREKFGKEPSDSDWGDVMSADVDIAIKGAQGAKQINPDLETKE